MLTAPENYKSSAGVKLKFLIRNKRVFPFKRIYVEHIEWNLLGHLHDLMRIIWIKYKSWKPYIYWWWHESRITKKNNKAAVTVTASWMLRKSANRVGNRSDLFFFLRELYYLNGIQCLSVQSCCSAEVDRNVLQPPNFLLKFTCR